MAESPSPTQSSPQSKQRSSIERAVVWGGIAILLGVVAYEFKVKHSFDTSHNNLMKAWEEAVAKDQFLTETDVKNYVYGYSHQDIKQPLEANPSNAQRQDTFTYTALAGKFSDGYGKRQLYVIYGQPGKEKNAKAEVLDIRIEPLETDASNSLREVVGDGRLPKSDDGTSKPKGFQRSESDEDQPQAKAPETDQPAVNENEEKPANPAAGENE